MTSPVLTVIVLAVLWLIVVVPMVLRRKDERAGERSVARFGSAMHALASHRGEHVDDPARGATHPNGADRNVVGSHPHPHPHRRPSAPAGHVNGAVSRRPVPVSKESLMYPPERNEMSDARRAMMGRRRRSLIVLGVGSAVFLILALITGNPLLWTVDVLLILGLGGYLYFLRAQARRDRERREARQRRSNRTVSDGYEVTAVVPAPIDVPESAVRIDEEDVHLDHLDTVDLTGLYSDAGLEAAPVRRAG